TLDNEVHSQYHQYFTYTTANSSGGLAINYHESLRYIPRSTVQTWKERDYLIVFGIPSIDIDERRRRRYLQRTTCWQYPGVARRANNFTGDMLVLYVLARHPSQGYNYSESLLKEVAEYHDIITLNINEGVSNFPKMVGGLGYYSLEAQMGLSQKTYIWFEMAVGLFSKVNYFSKGDDDMFLYVPQFLADLKVLPKRCLYWGMISGPRSPAHIYFAIGACYTLSRDVAETFLSYEPTRRLLSLPYSHTRQSEYRSLNVDCEDTMVARALHEVKSQCLVFVNESFCRFHDLHYNSYKRRASNSSVLLHHLKEKEYYTLMKMFSSRTAETAKTYKNIDGRIIFDC
ncbi:putative UDP-Gal or UDP-GlcNAc-dependent glycosyltransferase, partial [Trypanosoma theileri]